MDNIDRLRQRASTGRERADYLHPLARADPERDLRRHRLPGAGDADRRRSWRATRSAKPTLLRRAMGKKKTEEMAKQKARFVDGAPRRVASTRGSRRHIFDLVEKFAGYGFNKSHAAAYALIAYQTA